ncbi:uncharacterized protein LOC143300359 [Babylonia areolata]|uniref:uncharacterized protein LOC143300359 n=1 Tax=Babylonia areolata TaxID=304850 RepID=UPI003FD6414C
MDRPPDTDSLCDLMEACSLAEREKTKFRAQLADFPHTFQLQDHDERLVPNHLERLKLGLESALSVGYETNIETARARNMLAYILNQLNRPDDALEELARVLTLKDQHQNLVTLANKAVILYDLMRYSEAEELVQHLTEMKTQEKGFHYLVVLAKAELAFTYTRLGPSFFRSAIAKFEEVLPKARKPEKQLWQFGLALTKRRLLRATPQVMSAVKSAEIAAELRNLLSFLLEIAQNCDSRSLKAKTYSELATLLSMVSKTPTLNREFCSVAHMDVEQACEKALQHDSTDNSVLVKCGRILRYCRKTERSVELLEKALAIRPSSTAYHHLGLSYKALANNEKYKDRVKIPGFYRQLERLNAGSREPHHYDCARSQSRQISQFNRNASRHCHSGMESTAVTGSNMNDPIPLSLNRDVRVMQRVIKSPPTRGVTRYTKDDKYIKEVLHNFKKAVEFSQGQNTRALYDLAILQKSLGELVEAKKLLEEMMKQEHNLFTADLVNIYEQIGLIWKEIAESETDQAKKERMLQNSTTMLQRALASASEIFSRSPEIKEHLGELYSSFSVLLQDVDQSKNNHHWKLQEKASLYKLIRDHKQSLELLQEIKLMDPEKSKDPKYLKLYIENCVETRMFEKALTFVKLLMNTEHSTATMQLFEDKHYVMKIYIKAAHQALLQNRPFAAKLHFQHAFMEATCANQNDDSSSEADDTDSSESSQSETPETWQVCILHEETKESHANATVLQELLKDVFGLNVSTTGRNAAPNKLDLEGELRVLKRSTMVLVMAGGKVTRRTRFYLRNIATKTSTVTLLVDGEHVPQLLKANRRLPCTPQQLQKLKTAQSEKRMETEADSICKIFSFLINVEMTIEE